MQLADVAAGALYLRRLGLNGRPTLVLDTKRDHPDAEHFDRNSASDLLITQSGAADLQAAIEQYGLAMTVEQAYEFEANSDDFIVTVGRAAELALPLGDTDTLAAHAVWQLVNGAYTSRGRRNSRDGLTAAPRSFDDDGEGLLVTATRDTDDINVRVNVTIDDDSVRDLHAYLGAYLATLPGGPAALPTLDELETR